MIKKLLLLISVPFYLVASPFHTKQQIAEISQSVVKIYTTSVKESYYKPWQKVFNTSSSGTGVVIDNHMILTAAHVVSDATFIQVKKSNDAKKYIGKVKWIAHEADLALLEIEDETFFDNVTAQSFGGLPSRQDGVVVYGYPMGGDELSTTQGIVSRIEHTMYSHGYMDHLTLQIDAPINPGNSGGPAFDSDGKIVGIAIQAIGGADGLGYLVPVEVIKHFFTDIKDGTYDGYPSDGIGIQTLENENIKSYYHLGKRDGVLVTSITKNGSAMGYIKKGDVLLAVDGVNIAGDNTVKIKGNGRVASNYMVRKHQLGEELTIDVLRDKKEIQVKFPLKSRAGIAPLEHDKEPRYYIFGGLVFVPLTINYLQAWGKGWDTKAPMALLSLLQNQEDLDPELDELVVLSHILPNYENANYEAANKIVEKVNGKKVISLKGMVDSITKSKKRYINILFTSGNRIILDKENALKADCDTLEQYGVNEKQRLD